VVRRAISRENAQVLRRLQKVDSDDPKVDSDDPKVDSDDPKVDSGDPKVDSADPEVDLENLLLTRKRANLEDLGIQLKVVSVELVVVVDLEDVGAEVDQDVAMDVDENLTEEVEVTEVELKQLTRRMDMDQTTGEHLKMI